MRKFIVLLFLVFFLNGCATGNKYGQQTCKEFHGQFTKAVDCLELKFININPKKYQEYEKTHNLVLRALADQVYEKVKKKEKKPRKPSPYNNYTVKGKEEITQKWKELKENDPSIKFLKVAGMLWKEKSTEEKNTYA